MGSYNAACSCESRELTIGEMREWLRQRGYFLIYYADDCTVRSTYNKEKIKAEGYMYDIFRN